MFKADKLKALVNERLKAAAEEIFSIFESTIKDYEDVVFGSKREEDQQRRRAPVQISTQEEDAPLRQVHCEKKTDLCEDDQVKEEQQEEGWPAPAAEKQQVETDNKDSLNIILVQKNDEDGRQFTPHQNQEVVNPGDRNLPSSSCEHLKSDEEGHGASEPTSDCQMSDVSDDGGGGVPSGGERKKSQRAGETAADRPYACGVCSKSFRMKSILTRHMKTHTGEKPYRCSVCSKSFIQRSYLQTHMNAHSGQKPYTCSFCGRGFTQVGNMNAHVRIHTGEKPHSCTDCGKSFREKADLIKHTVIHTGEKPYSCTVCDMKFSAQSNLTRHMKTHSGERPYSCSACGKRFIRRSHLIIHMKTHDGENT